MENKKMKKIQELKGKYLNIWNLYKNKEYEEIYEDYGKKTYEFLVPKSYKKRNINELYKEGKFKQIHERYGKYGENWYINKDNKLDISSETVIKLKGKIKKAKNSVKRAISAILVSLPIALPLAGVAGQEIMHEGAVLDGHTKYAEQIAEYDIDLINKAQEIKNMGLTDIQIFAKVIKDMWEEIEGYATPKNEISGYGRLSLKKKQGEKGEEGGVGVCRNFANHVTTLLNLINSEYNAVDVIVYLSDVDRLANIKRNIIEEDETIRDGNEQETDIDKFDFTKLTGNHKVTAVDIPGKNISLIIDSTNPGIGIFINGRIYMFSSKDGRGIQIIETFQILDGGIESVANINRKITNSFMQPEGMLDTFEAEWGIDALNKALDEVTVIEENMKAEKGKQFVAKAKVNEEEAIKKVTENAWKEYVNDREKVD